jgi:hypothetical protein
MNHFILIDQAALCGTHDWTTADLSDAAAAYNLPPHLGAQFHFSEVEPVVDRVIAIPEADIRACFESFPDGWGITPDMIDKVTEFLMKRRAHLKDVLRRTLNP